MNMARTAIVGKNSEFWDKLIEARKNPAAQASLLGFDIIFRFLFRQLTADDVIRRVAERLGLKGRADFCPFAEIGMDVDKPHQLEIMRAHLRTPTSRAARQLVHRPKAHHKTSTSSRKPADRSARPHRHVRGRRKSTTTARSGRTKAGDSNPGWLDRLVSASHAPHTAIDEFRSSNWMRACRESCAWRRNPGSCAPSPYSWLTLATLVLGRHLVIALASERFLLEADGPSSCWPPSRYWLPW